MASVQVSNNTTSPGAAVTTSTKLAYAYAGVGSGGMVANVFIIAVLISDKKFLKQSAMIAGIAASHFLCAFAIGASGLYRSINIAAQNQRISTWLCIARVFPAVLPLAFQSLGVMLVLAGIERLAVFLFPNWYRTKWTNKMSWRLVAVGYFCSLVSFCGGLYSVSNQPSTTTSFCGYQSIFGKKYYAYCSAVSAVGGTIAVALTLSGFVRGIRQAKALPLLSGEAGRHRRQLKLTRSMLSIAMCDFCLVVVPSFLFVLSFLNPELFPVLRDANFSNFTNITYCVNTMTMVPYLAYNKAFRTRTCEMLQCKNYVGSAKVGVMATNRVIITKVRSTAV